MSDQTTPQEPQESSWQDELKPEVQKLIAHLSPLEAATWAVENFDLLQTLKKQPEPPPAPTLTSYETEVAIASGLSVDVYLAQKLKIEAERKAENERHAASIKAMLDSQSKR